MIAALLLGPVGVFVDFRRFNTSGEESGRVFGTVQENVGRKVWSVHGYPGDREIFPFLGDHIFPGDSFGMTVDNAILLPIGETLNPYDTFFSQTLPECSRRLRT